MHERRRPQEIGGRTAPATTLVTDENVAIVMPNSQFISERVTNWSRPGRLTATLVPFAGVTVAPWHYVVRPGVETGQAPKE